MGVRGQSNLQMGKSSSFAPGNTNSLIEKYQELNNKFFNNVIVKRNSKGSLQTPKQVISIPTAAQPPQAAAGGNPIFVHKKKIYDEYTAQKTIADQKFLAKGYLPAVMYSIHRMYDEQQRNPNVVFNNDNRHFFLHRHSATLDSSKIALKELEDLGYLTIVKKRQKYHDYRLSAKAITDLKHLKVYKPMDYNNTNTANESYLFPFDPKAVIERELVTNPEDIRIQFSYGHILPYQDSYIMVDGPSSVVDMIDYRDYSFKEKDMSSNEYKQLFNYLGTTEMANNIASITADASKRGEKVLPQYIMDDGIVFSSPQRKFMVPKTAVHYLYNKYYGQDIELSIVPTTQSSSNGRVYYRSYSQNSSYILVAKRTGSPEPLFAYRFNQEDEKIETIV